MKNKALRSSVFALALLLFILSFSIALPIYLRPFYYAHISPLDLEAASGYSKAEIKEAYNSLLDYLTIPGKEFSVGPLPYSDRGASHFKDCKFLFLLDTFVLIISATVTAVMLILKRRLKWQEFKIGKLSASLCSAIGAITLPIIVGILAATDFERAFKIFHKIFFPGKINWYFNPELDPIINVLPVQFFMNCAILIGVSILLISAAIIIFNIKKKPTD